MYSGYTEELFTSNDKNTIVGTVSSILNDGDVAASLVYEQFTSTTFDPTTQSVVSSWSRVVCNGVKGNYTFEEQGNPNVERDDIFFLIPQSVFSVPVEIKEGKEDNILEKIYDTGSVNVTNGSDTITSYGDTADFGIARAGDAIKIGSEATYYEIKSSAEATLTLMTAYSGDTATNQSFELFRRWRIVGIEEDLLKITYKFQCRGL
ncbi:MAG: hypothetical protein DRI01_00570 [Chloroflexi bacterium]|nr:MAG: hypothetical protein DRI01_00570 [Chloroflexota bacterium]